MMTGYAQVRARFVLLLSLTLSVAGTVATAGDIVDEQLLKDYAVRDSADIFVKMADDADLSMADTITERVSRVQYVYDALTSHAEASQAALQAYLDSQGVEYQTFWINNSLYIPNASRALAEALSDRPDVAYIRGDYKQYLDLPVERLGDDNVIHAVEWGVNKIRAPEVWAAGYTGEGVVVANIDTGVRYTHEALNQHYRGKLAGGSYNHNYNWFDPTGTYPSAPGDNNGHGTHTMGTMVGGDGPGSFSNDIGVAPGAKWIAAKGCESSSCSDLALIRAAQWIACPRDLNGKNPDCSKAPDIVNNSWGGGGGENWYESYVKSWVKAGILPVFSIGNNGPNCYTAGSPGDYRYSFGVGATDSSDVLAWFSSKGPGLFKALKPDVTAPGANVRSSVNTSDTAYAYYSGTSMAAPHVAGAAALLLSKRPSLSVIQLYKALTKTAVQGLGNPPDPDTCGGRAYTKYPNAIYGYGRIDVKAAYDLLP